MTSICLIGWKITADYFKRNKASSCLSFFVFTDEDPIRGARPYPIAPVSIRARCLIGMPSSFPTFAFRKSKFTLPFNEELTAGVDCDWIFRNLRESGHDGQLVPQALVYYRLHEQQISSQKRDLQKQVVVDCLHDLHGQILQGPVTEFEEVIEKLSGWTPLERGGDLDDIWRYYQLLGEGLENYRGCDPAEIRQYLHFAWMDQKIRRLEGDYRKLSASYNQLKNHGGGDVRCRKSGGGLQSTLLAGIRPVVSRMSSAKVLKKFDETPGPFFADLVRKRLPGGVRMQARNPSGDHKDN